MDNKRSEQLEALNTLSEYNERVIKNIPILIRELSGERLEDTDKFQNSILSAINWEIQVLNATLEVINEGMEKISKKEFNDSVLNLNRALEVHDDSKLVEAFKGILIELKKLDKVIKETLV